MNYEQRITRLETEMTNLDRTLNELKEQREKTNAILFSKIDTLARYVYMGLGAVAVIEVLFGILKK